jgi:hypothetical protein
MDAGKQSGLSNFGPAGPRRLKPPKDCKSGEKEGSLMIDTKIVLALALLLSSSSLIIGGSKPPAGGLPIPQHDTGVSNAQ